MIERPNLFDHAEGAQAEMFDLWSVQVESPMALNLRIKVQTLLRTLRRIRNDEIIAGLLNYVPPIR